MDLILSLQCDLNTLLEDAPDDIKEYYSTSEIGLKEEHEAWMAKIELQMVYSSLLLITNSKQVRNPNLHLQGLKAKLMMDIRQTQVREEIDKIIAEKGLTQKIAIFDEKNRIVDEKMMALARKIILAKKRDEKMDDLVKEKDEIAEEMNQVNREMIALIDVIYPQA